MSIPNVKAIRDGMPTQDMPQTTSGRIAAGFRKDIISNRLAPGSRLIIRDLAKQYEVGSTVVREALFQVMTEGLVHSEENRGFAVAPIDSSEMLDISTLRSALEVRAVGASIRNGDIEWETRIITARHYLKDAKQRYLNRPTDGDDDKALEDNWEIQHQRLHLALCSACNSPWLIHFISILYDHLERYRRYFWDYSERITHADDQHEQLAEAALSRDETLTTRLLENHFQTQAELSLSVGRQSAGSDNDN